MAEDKIVWEGKLGPLGPGAIIYDDGTMIDPYYIRLYTLDNRSLKCPPFGNEAEQVWRAAFLDLRETSKKVVATQTRDSRDRAIDELAKKIGMET